MALCRLDCVPGTIVHHRWKKISEPVGNGERWRLERRPVIRCGVVVGVNGDPNTGIESVAVKFNPSGPAENIPLLELDRVSKANTRVAKLALAKVQGRVQGVGEQFVEAPPQRERVVDAVGIREIRNELRAVDVDLEAAQNDIANEPLVVQDGGGEAAESDGEKKD